MILNPFKCEKCGKELQPEDIGIKVNDEDSESLIRICMFCGNEVKIQEKN